MENYKTIHKFGKAEITIEKSLFIGYAKPIESEEEARNFIDEIKSKHKDATHNVWAYTVGKDMNIQRYSDDGEPQGTAGIPTLEVIKKENLRNVAVVVTRYFGGIKLGAGGLVRAYTQGAKIGLVAGEIVEKLIFTLVSVEIDYNLLGKVQNELMNLQYNLGEIEYLEKVKINVYCPQEKVEELKLLMTDITSATAVISEKENFYLSSKDGKIIFD